MPICALLVGMCDLQNARFIRAALPNNCNPIGKRCPSTSAKPHGTLIPQIPARFAAMVKISREIHLQRIVGAFA